MLFNCVIYHMNCHDGFSSAAIYYKYLKENYPEKISECQFIPAAYNGKPPNIKNKDVLILDYSYETKVTEQINKDSKSLLIIDHHKTAISRNEGINESQKIIKMDKCGATLTWDYFFPNQEVPIFLKYIEDRDIWLNKMPFFKEVFLAITLMEKNLESWEKIISNNLQSDINKLIKTGKVLKIKEDRDVNDLLKSSYSKRLKLNDTTYKVAYVNSKLYRSDLGHQLLKKHTDCDFSAVYFYSGMFDKTQFSLRSLDDGADVSKIAESFKTGGGGHKCAAGMSLKGSHIKL